MKKALLVIDAQRIYTDKESELCCKDAKNTVTRVNALIDAFEKSGDLIVFVRHEHKEDGSDLGRMFDFSGEKEEDFNFKRGSEEVKFDPALKGGTHQPEIVKNRYSAFVGTNLEELLRNKGIDTVVVCGFMTNFCCDSTARDAHDKGYWVQFIADATGTPGTDNYDEKQLREIISELLGAGYAQILTTKNYLKGNQ